MSEHLRTGDPALPNVFTVPPGRPFLEALARAVLEGHLPRPGGPRPDPMALSAWTILLPTRRAQRALQEAFLAAADGAALILPTIRPIAEADEDLALIESARAAQDLARAALAIPPAIGSLERTLLLTRLVLAWSAAVRAQPAGDDDADHAPVLSAGAATPAQAARLAAELARLIDTVETENVSLARIGELVPAGFSGHWQQTLDFLRIVTEFWPAHLAEHGLLSPADRRNRLILAEARRLAETPPEAPLIVAGVTGSVPATAELMRAVARHPQGAIVLPGLDPHLDAESFARVPERHPEHPQHELARLLRQLGIARGDVRELFGTALDAARAGRNRLVSEAMRPSGTMAGWRRLKETADPDQLRRALKGVSLIETASSEDEAEVAALILREALETPGRTAALVSPDRLLARRVAARLEAWGIRVDDSAGRPFAKTVPGSFLDLVANAAGSGFAPAELMALLKHPLTRLGLEAGRIRRAARNLEIAAFRTPYLGSGLASVEHAVEMARMAVASGERRPAAVLRMREEDWADVRELVARLATAFEPFERIEASGREHPFSALVAAHVEVAEAVARPPDEIADATADTGSGAALASPLWARDEGSAAALLLARLMSGETAEPAVGLADYPELLRTLVGSESIRTRVPRHPRLAIWGPYEARLLEPDVVVLGSLNEGVWPKAADPGPWLSRGMRASLGLSSPEEECGRAAHDLTMLLGAGTVHLTRANKVDGVPMVASRWLLRLKALLSGLGLETALAPEKPWARWASARDVARRLPPIRAPEPRPPVALRPRRASVSDVETWLANPYAIFARRILSLEVLPPLGQEPGPAERGQIVHAALARFTKAHPRALPADVAGAFMAAADEVIGALLREPRVRAFWRPRLQRFADWFAETEAGRRAPGSDRLAEIAGRLILEAPAGPFTLVARADRIDVTAAGLVITDYKTGRLPTLSEVEAGEAPQLPLEAAMAAAGAFPGLATGEVVGLRYIRATGGEPPGEETSLAPKAMSIAELGRRALGELERLVAEFDEEATPYRALRRRRFEYAYDEYAHLARVGEWAGEDDGGGAR